MAFLFTYAALIIRTTKFKIQCILNEWKITACMLTDIILFCFKNGEILFC